MEGKQCAFPTEDFEFDEDVILPNTPLGAYIEELKFEGEMNFLDNSFKNQKSESHLNNYKPKISSHMTVKTHWEKLKTYFNCVYNYFTSFFSSVDNFLSTRILLHIKSSGTLVDEDVTFLNNWVLGGTDLATNAVRHMSFLFFSSVVMVFAISWHVCDINLWNMAYVSPLHFRNMFENSLPIFGFFYLLILTIIVLFISMNSIKIINLTVVCFHLQSILSTTKKTIVLIKKNIRLIQEAELTSRGFTSTSHSSIAERIEISSNLPIVSSHRHYPTLRKSVFMWAKELFLCFRFSTLQLLQTIQLGPDFDFSSHSLAMLDLEEFGDIMQFDLNDNEDLEKLLKVTDNFSISSLRTMFSLLELQVSEYFKYLYLTLSFAKPSRPYYSRNYQVMLFQLLRNVMLCKNNSILPKVSEAYKYYRCIEASFIPEPVSKPESSHHYALEIDLHSMSLHLKAALLRLLEAEEFLGTKNSSDVTSCDVSLKHLKNLIDQANGEVKAFNESYYSYNAQLDTFLSSSKSEIPNVVLPQMEHCLPTDTVKAVVRCDVEQELKDEVFEDVATKSQFKDSECKENIDFEIKKNTEMASCLMHELKNVLVVKADEHRLREEKALALKVSSPESSCEKNIESNTKTSISGEKKIESSTQTSISCEKNNEIETKAATAVDDLKTKSDIPRQTLTSCEKDLQGTQLNCIDSKQNFNGMNNFAASIAALANQRKITLGVSTDDCFIGGSSDSSDEDT